MVGGEHSVHLLCHLDQDPALDLSKGGKPAPLPCWNSAPHSMIQSTFTSKDDLHNFLDIDGDGIRVPL